MSQRFFVETPIGDSNYATLVEAEAHHVTKVMRAKPGDHIITFDGSGSEFKARIVALGKSEVDLEVLSRSEVNRELQFPITLAAALPKGDRQKVLVEKLVELGITALIPLETDRSVAEATPSAIERLRRQVVEASKQCGRNRLMQIREPLKVAALLQNLDLPPIRILAHPEGCQPTWESPASAVIAAVGPEGGFTAGEIQLATDFGWQLRSLGPRILRIETAAITLAARLGMH